MKKIDLYPDPGNPPDEPEPKGGSTITVKLSGYPPYKDRRFSIRNPKHRHYERFVKLRKSATLKMNGRKWYDGPIEMNLEVHAPSMEKNIDLNDYIGGVMDTLDGSHGPSFTYLPVVYQDDCQVALGRHRFIKSSKVFYLLEIVFHEYKEITETSFTYHGPVHGKQI
jgi:hypothetical protein